MVESARINGTDMGEVQPQYMYWYLGREPGKNEIHTICSFLEGNNAELVENLRYRKMFRIFHESTVSVHISLFLKHWGFSVNVHVDIGIHFFSFFNRQSLEILSKLYNYLKKMPDSRCFLLPREENEFQFFKRSGWIL